MSFSRSILKYSDCNIACEIPADTLFVRVSASDHQGVCHHYERDRKVLYYYYYYYYYYYGYYVAR